MDKSPKRLKKYLALDVHINMNICKFSNVYDAAIVAIAAHKDILYDEYATVCLLFLCLHRMHIYSSNTSHSIFYNEHFMS